jgi:hypothetical protein
VPADALDSYAAIVLSRQQTRAWQVDVTVANPNLGELLSRVSEDSGGHLGVEDILDARALLLAAAPQAHTTTAASVLLVAGALFRDGSRGVRSALHRSSFMSTASPQRSAAARRGAHILLIGLRVCAQSQGDVPRL